MAVTPLGLWVFVGEVGKTFEFTVEKPDPENPGQYIARSLVGAAVSLVIEGVGSFACDVVDAANGRADRVVEAGDYTVPGVYQARLILSWTEPTVKTIKTPLFEFEVRPAL